MDKFFKAFRLAALLAAMLFGDLISIEAQQTTTW
jgi:hypothetical protein